VNAWLLAGQIVAAILGGAGVTQVVQAFARRRPTRVEAVEKLNDATLKWAEELEKDAAAAREQAREQAREARVDATECHRQMAAVRREATALADELHRIVRAVHDPYMSLDRLRVMVPFPPANGSTKI